MTAFVLPLFLSSLGMAAQPHPWCVPGQAMVQNDASSDATTRSVVDQVCGSFNMSSCCNPQSGRWSLTCVQKGADWLYKQSGKDPCGRFAWNQGPVSNTSQYYPRDFSLVTLGGGVNTLRDVHGPVAANGDFSPSTGFSVNGYTKQPFAVIATGNVTFSSGSVYGNVAYGGTYTPNYVTYRNGGQASKSTPISSSAFASASSKLTDMSAILNGANYPATKATRDNQTVVFSKQNPDPELNVFWATSDQVSGATSFDFEVPSGSSVIVNVRGTDIALTNAGIFTNIKTGLPINSRILWNFPDATSLWISSMTINGSILAPKAVGQLYWGQVYGTVVLKSVGPENMELHWAPYHGLSAAGCLSWDPSWSCASDTYLNDNGTVGIDAPEAGFIELNGGPYVAEGANRTSPKNRIWYSFQPAASSPDTKPLAVLFNGGPGSATMAYLFSLNTGPWTLDPQVTGGQQIVYNPQSWTQFANLLYIDAPGTGFSYPLPLDDGSKPSFGIDIDREAGMFLRFIVRFLARHPALLGNPVLTVGESYGGTRATLMLDYLYNYGALSGTTAAYRDSDLANDLKDYFSAVFGTQTPTAAQIATKFGKQVLIQPAVVGKLQIDKGESDQDLSICLADHDDYFCDHASGWSTGLFKTAHENLMRIATLTKALGVNPMSIEWMKPSSRTQAYGRGASTSNNVVIAPELTNAFGSLATDDNYFLAYNSPVAKGYVVSTTPKPVYSRSWYNAGQSVGSAFLRVLENVTTFMTNARFDTAIWTPAIPLVLRDPAFAGVVSSSVYNPSQANGLDRPGLVTITYSSGTSRVFPLPTYDSGHTVPLRAPADILADVKKWYVSPPAAAASSRMSIAGGEATEPAAVEETEQTPATPAISGEPHPYIGP